MLAIPREEVILASAKEGTGVDRDPGGDRGTASRRPKGDPAAPLQGAHLRLATTTPTRAWSPTSGSPQGTLNARDDDPADGLGRRRRSCSSWASSGRSWCPMEQLGPGEVGYVATGLKSVRDCQVGDTITLADRAGGRAAARLQAGQAAGLRRHLPARRPDYPLLRDALEKLHLNDASITYEPESSVALGFGFRCGFLGLLHMEIIQERLEREFDLDLIASAPSVEYQRHADRTDAASCRWTTRRGCPARATSRRSREPWVTAQHHHAEPLHRTLMELATSRRGAFKNMEYLDAQRVLHHLRAAARRAHRGLLRPAQVPHAGLRLAGLRGVGYRPARPGQARRAGQRRAGRRPVADRAPRQGPISRAARWSRSCGAHPAPDVRGAGPGGHRLATSSPARRSARCARTCSPSATAATSPASASCWRSRKRASSA